MDQSDDVVLQPPLDFDVDSLLDTSRQYESRAPEPPTMTPDALPEEAPSADFGVNPTSNRKRRKHVPFDASLLMSQNGLPWLVQESSKLAFQGKGHEQQDLKKLLFFYQMWFHQLDSRISFEAAIKKTENLCRSKRLKIFASARLNEERRRKAGIQDSLTRDEEEPMAVAVNDTVPTSEEMNDQDSNTIQADGDFITTQTDLDAHVMAKIRANKERALAKLAEKRRLMENRMEQDGMSDMSETEAPLF